MLDNSLAWPYVLQILGVIGTILTIAATGLLFAELAHARPTYPLAYTRAPEVDAQGDTGIQRDVAEALRTIWGTQTGTLVRVFRVRARSGNAHRERRYLDYQGHGSISV